jgi:hypothetical protein
MVVRLFIPLRVQEHLQTLQEHHYPLNMLLLLVEVAAVALILLVEVVLVDI